MLRIDARVPVRFGSTLDIQNGDAMLTEGQTATLCPSASFTASAGVHPAGCACCTPRSLAALALADLFTRRARGSVEFRSVLAITSSEAGRAAVADALRFDPVASARYRLIEPFS